MNKVTVIVKTYDAPAKTDVRVHSDWDDAGYVLIEAGDETRRVRACDLLRAIDSATNR